MRLDQHEYGYKEWCDFFCRLYGSGIRRLHVSSEYESYPLFCRVNQELLSRHPHCRFSFVVKLADPHFSDARFERDRFLGKIEFYRNTLNVDQIETVQWMWRQGLRDDCARIQSFSNQFHQIRDAISFSKESGLCKNVFCFPYTPAFSEAALQSEIFDGQTVYLNPAEAEYKDLVDRWGKSEKSTMAIRPFGGEKRLAHEYDISYLLDYCFGRPGVSGVVVTATQDRHLSALLEYFDKIAG